METDRGIEGETRQYFAALFQPQGRLFRLGCRGVLSTCKLLFLFANAAL